MVTITKVAHTEQEGKAIQSRKARPYIPGDCSPEEACTVAGHTGSQGEGEEGPEACGEASREGSKEVCQTAWIGAGWQKLGEHGL